MAVAAIGSSRAMRTGSARQQFEVEATAYIDEGLQPPVEVNLFSQDGPHRGIASGSSTAGAGFRLRYEFARKFAPYAGVAYERALETRPICAVKIVNVSTIPASSSASVLGAKGNP